MVSRSELEGILDNCTVVKEFPASGQKKVFLVRDASQREKIVKVVADGDDRIAREIEIVTQNKIPYVPKIYDFRDFEWQGIKYNYIVEEYIEGLTLKEKLAAKKLTLHEGVRLLETLLQISVVLEDMRTVHRDIKPDNIMCGIKGEYYLIDFGIARQLDKPSLTMTEAAIGPHTPGYGAPELFQYSRIDIDIKSDLFSIGVVLFEALTGHHPFLTGDEWDLNEVWYKTKTVTPKDYLIEGDTNKQLLGFIETLMQKHPTRRPSTAKKALELFSIVIPTLEGGEM